MSIQGLSAEEVVRRGRAIYENKLRSELEPGNKGKLLVINVETGEYEMDADDVAAGERAKSRFPHAPLFTMRIGYRAAYRLGGRALEAGAP
jgi:hypothetical protein